MIPWLSAEASSAVVSAAPTIASAITMLAVVIQGVSAHRKGKNGKHVDVAGIVSGVRVLVELHEKADTEQFNAVRRDVQSLHDHLVGPDGENGIRSDVRSIAQRLGDMEKRERERLEAGYDRRRAVT